MKEEKAIVIETMREWVKSSPYLIVIDYTGMKVSEFSELRGRLRKVGAAVKVVKNTLFKRALGEASLPVIDKDLAGQTAVVSGGQDAPAAAKVIKTFKSEFTRPAVRAGVMDGKILGVSEITMLADLPSAEVLRAKLLGAIAAPASTLVRLLAEPGSRLARVVRTKTEAAPMKGSNFVLAREPFRDNSITGVIG
ncbi:MAG: 50S ribosomal protein L10 [Verrucomicrobia bacterium]|nr:50S ribosomal protein L10 [Verrucomicrobiota bacterium]